MPYLVRKTDGNVLITLADGIIDTSTGLNLVGRSFTGYGEYLADNFVRLLENFANVTAPENPLDGQIWYDSGNDVLRYWTNNQWLDFSAPGPTGPVGPVGPPGATGVVGPVGDPGPTGPTGPVGNTGSQGIIGYSGSVGPIGATGDIGSFGYTGSFGATGLVGPAGATGLTGYRGPQGATGTTGFQGPSGAIGLVGRIGYTGSVGPSGPVGPAISANISFSNQTISGTNANTNVIISSLGTGSVVFTSNLRPSSNAFSLFGDYDHQWYEIHSQSIVFSDGSTISSGNALAGKNPPASSIGGAGDYRGLISLDNSYFYYCTGSYDGLTNIWKRMAWAVGTW